jgi:phospholipid transport system substrate-binding protein
MKHFVAFVVMAFLASGTIPAWGAASRTEDVRKTVDEVVRIVSDKELKKPQNEQKRRKALKAAIGKIFDHAEMAKRSMGQNWKELTPVQQKEFTDLFATLLESSYAGKIESYNNEKIIYLKEIEDGDYAEVKSRIVTARHDEFSLDYRLMREGDRWKVYDIVIEGVSLVSNYRSQFNKIIKAQGYQELVKKMKSRKDDLAAS